jgi:hypothetical protein
MIKKTRNSYNLAADDGLILTQEGSNCRVTGGVLEYLFANTTEDQVRNDYIANRQVVRSVIAPRWESLDYDELNPKGLAKLVRDITLHWMHYYIINDFPVTVTKKDISHPQTRRIIREQMEFHFGKLTDDAIRAGARLFGVSPYEFRSGLEADDHYEALW